MFSRTSLVQTRPRPAASAEITTRRFMLKRQKANSRFAPADHLTTVFYLAGPVSTGSRLRLQSIQDPP
jgi:hypothetical protein